MTRRTLFHLIYMNPSGYEYWFRVPAWNSNLAVRVTDQNIHPDLLDHLEVGNRYHGMYNPYAESEADLNIYINET